VSQVDDVVIPVPVVYEGVVVEGITEAVSFALLRDAHGEIAERLHPHDRERSRLVLYESHRHLPREALIIRPVDVICAGRGKIPRPHLRCLLQIPGGNLIEAEADPIRHRRHVPEQVAQLLFDPSGETRGSLPTFTEPLLGLADNGACLTRDAVQRDMEARRFVLGAIRPLC
jgi:hypothetical protein